MTSSLPAPPRLLPQAAFACPLRTYPLPAALPAFESFAACNAAVAEYQAARDADRDRQAEELYARMIPLVQKSLRRFCHPYYEESRCYAGACYPEELIGETYLWFREALDAFDPARGVDFVGFAAQRLFWAEEHRVRGLTRAWAVDEVRDEMAVDPSEEDRALDRATVQALLARLEPGDAALATRAAEGYSSRELAAWAGISETAVRKRLERIRARLRSAANGG